jgi:hypothetical protein
MTSNRGRSTAGQAVKVVAVGEPLIQLTPRAGTRLADTSELEIHTGGAEETWRWHWPGWATASPTSVGSRVPRCRRAGKGRDVG